VDCLQNGRPRHIREYQASLFQKRKFSPNTVAQHPAALRFFYIKTLKTAWSITETPYPKRAVRLPTMLSQEEVTRLIDAAHPPLHALDEQQQKVAIVDPNAYADILTAASRKAALQGQASGLSASKMNSNQFDALMALMEEYAHNVSDELAEGRRELINKAGRNIYFAASGGISRGDPHYYRVQTPSFLIELDDTQDDANHIHSVWRDFQRRLWSGPAPAPLPSPPNSFTIPTFGG
jgi:hypothetical protein